MEYADYAFYKTEYKGNAIPEADFSRLVARASSYLERIAGDQVKQTPVSGSVKMAACAVAEAWQTNEQGGDVVSQSVGSWSKHFNKASKSDDDRLHDAAKLYLGALASKVRWT